jgi:hypothetical protein
MIQIDDDLQVLTAFITRAIVSETPVTSTILHGATSLKTVIFTVFLYVFHVGAH